MNPLRKNILKHFCLVLFLCATAKSFPAEDLIVAPAIIKNSSPAKVEGSTSSTESITSKKSQPSSASSISTTSSLLFKDKKPILTYLLGQPKKQGSVSSPAQLLSPDRYEFFTFDDDGQIVKKLMSVKEIQKIIANSEKGSLEEHGSPIEYYQILTVTPDVESIPTVSRINPNEPLFSIHDVIASVQNVLKSEMKTKQSQSSSGVNNTNFLASASSTHFEILTDEPAKPQTAEIQKPTSTASQQTNEPTFTFKLDEPVKVTTYRPTSQINFNFLKGNVVSGSSGTQKPNVQTGSETTQKPLEILASILTQKPYTLITSTATQKTQEPATLLQAEPTSSGSKPAQLVSSAASKPKQPVASSKPLETAASSVSQETLVSAASTHKIINEAGAGGVPVTESRPLSLSDAHPGLLSNESFLDMKPVTVEQISRIEEPVIQELKEASPSKPSGNFVKVETVEKNQVPVQQQTAQVSAVETSTSKILLPITADLADSVSSVLWQIASENSMIEGSAKTTEVSSISSAATESPEEVVLKEESSEKISTPVSTTELPAQSRSTVKIEKLSENPLTVLQNILRTQNRPRPFQKIPTIEKGTPDVAELRNEPFITTTPAYETFSSPSSTVVILTESEETSSSSEETVSSELPAETNQNTNEEVSSTVAPQQFVILVSPDAVVQSPEHLKPVTDKAQIVNFNKTSSQNQTIEGVQVIQEANIGQIPRTTEIPGQVVKEIQRMEIPITDFVATEETLSNSASNTYSTQVPQTVPETTTTVGSEEEKTEIALEKESENSRETTITSLDIAETKTDDQKESSPSERVDITFVPMLIKTPSEYKQEEALLKSEIQTESKEEAETTTEKLSSEKATEVTELYVTETSNPTSEEESFESKELPESTSEPKTDVPRITTESAQKETILADDLISDDEFSQFGTLKQNTQNNKPHFGKPQKPVYIKPIKTKPQSDVKLPKPSATTKPFLNPVREPENKKPYENHLQSSPSVLELEAAPDENLGLEATVANLDGDIKRFADLCNELAFSLWSSVTHNGLSFVRSLVISPFAVTSLLAMVFLGARGPTSGQMNDVLRLDDMVTFNPHLVFRNVTESLVISRNPGVATAAFVRELYSDKSKGKLLDFYKERVQQFYDGHVEEVNFKTIGDTLRRQTNHLVKRQTWGKITDFLRGSNLMPRPPLAAFGANIFQTDCTRASTKDRDGEMYFVILPASRLRRLVPIPAVVWRDGFLAGYEPNLDATAVSINPSDSAVSTIFVLPGQQGLIAPGDTLARLEHHLLGSSYKKGHWSRLMRSLLPRPGLELQIPRLSHKSVINVTTSLQRMGLKDLFSADKADLTGLNGLANDLHLSDMLQVNLFSTCGEEPIGARHHSEIYPATPILRREKSADNIFSESVDSLWAVSDFEDPAISALPLELRPRQARVPLSKPGARIPEPPRLRFDRPFLFFVRHNPTGLILHMGRFNPRLMP